MLVPVPVLVLVLLARFMLCVFNYVSNFCFSFVRSFCSHLTAYARSDFYVAMYPYRVYATYAHRKYGVPSC